jgi:hypothetical protein
MPIDIMKFISSCESNLFEHIIECQMWVKRDQLWQRYVICTNLWVCSEFQFYNILFCKMKYFPWWVEHFLFREVAILWLFYEWKSNETFNIFWKPMFDCWTFGYFMTIIRNFSLWIDEKSKSLTINNNVVSIQN